MVRIQRQDDDWLGIALAAVGGLTAGIVAGVVLGELFGDLSTDRFKRLVGRVSRRRVREPLDPRVLRRAVRAALEDHDETRTLAVSVEAHEDGVVELTGVAPDAASRDLAGELAREVPGADVVVNRILVEGTDVPNKAPRAR